ncbi:MAG: Glu/Leu/Phe/Val dehydrogenase [bacterium]|nr:Glu/Leu/Phe/Val dehydrogenase [bacterium]
MEGKVKTSEENLISGNPYLRECDSPMYRAALAQLDDTACLLHLDDGIHQRLRQPKRALLVSIPVKMDNGSTRVFAGYRVQHNLTLGPSKGGIRYQEDVSLGEVAALAMWMSWKCSLMNLPYGGAKGGVAVKPYELSQRELEGLTRRFTAELLPFIGPEMDIPAPDMGTNEQIMAWMMDTYSMISGHTVHGAVTSKPVLLGGSLLRAEATGKGAVYVFEHACKSWGWNPAEMTAVIQGFGNVGSVAAASLDALGTKIVAVGDRTGAIRNEKGLDVQSLIRHKLENGDEIKGFPGAEEMPKEELLYERCDLLVPAALGGVITKENADRLRCRFILEGANGPVTPEADDILAEKNVIILPDVLANAGGVTVSYLEWVQDTQHFFWEADEVDARLRKIMARAFHEVKTMSEQKEVSLRRAALILGVQRVAEAKKLRGLYP